MKITELVARLRARRAIRRRDPLDRTIELTVRDWADLPVYHPRVD